MCQVQEYAVAVFAYIWQVLYLSWPTKKFLFSQLGSNRQQLYVNESFFFLTQGYIWHISILLVDLFFFSNAELHETIGTSFMGFVWGTCVYFHSYEHVKWMKVCPESAVLGGIVIRLYCLYVQPLLGGKLTIMHLFVFFYSNLNSYLHVVWIKTYLLLILYQIFTGSYEIHGNHDSLIVIRAESC